MKHHFMTFVASLVMSTALVVAQDGQSKQPPSNPPDPSQQLQPD